MALVSQSLDDAIVYAKRLRALRHLWQEFLVIERSGNKLIIVRPSVNNFLQWHFALHSLPRGSSCKQGWYRGRLHFPVNYPHGAPTLLLRTSSNRLTKVVHPDSWDPSRSIETMLNRLRSYLTEASAFLAPLPPPASAIEAPAIRTKRREPKRRRVEAGSRLEDVVPLDAHSTPTTGPHVASRKEVCAMLLRSVLLVALLTGLEAASAGLPDRLALPVRILVVAAVTLLVIHRVAVLTVSLPPNREPPQNNMLMRLYVADQQKLAMHMAEGSAALCFVVILSLAGMLTWFIALPYLLLGVLPIAKLHAQRIPSLHLIQRSISAVLMAFASPVRRIWRAIVQLARYHAQSVFHPLGACPHLGIAAASLVLIFTCDSNVPVVMLWTVDSVILTMGFFECAFERRHTWQEDVLWVIALLLSALAAFAANTLRKTPWTGIGAPRNEALVVLIVSLIWVCFLAAYVTIGNKRALIAHFREWQRRYGNLRCIWSQREELPLAPLIMV
eukprot:TRINITY_DN18847_c0_g1_i1.p1 TRINITY_DN18847_c0_g1~~TRINITY_DN18847_c0_g1_i1.p1  ORF type:complete len:513 (-),score=54.70 TRINITY_DN18847_c0_g1_i1:79-1581(-)